MEKNWNFKRFNQQKTPRSRVELHLHFEGAFRAETIWDLSKMKGIDLGASSLTELKSKLEMQKPETLGTFLERIGLIMPVFIDDLDAIERAAFELCEDESKQGVIYFEVRFAPRTMCTNLTPGEVVASIIKGLQRGEIEFGVKARVILCCLVPTPQYNEETLDLCLEFRRKGVVGIDIAGDESKDNTPDDIKQKCVFDIFKKAKTLGIHRTVHAGEVGTSANVLDAMTKMEAERLGHAYRALQDPEVYAQVLQRKIHTECCPHSSIYTGAVSLTEDKHPIIRFAEDGANFSINKDDPLITGTTLDDEYRLLRHMGLQDAHFVRANFNAARASFLPAEEKISLIKELGRAYGIENILSFTG